MTPSQAYAQWKQYAADPSDSEARSIQKFPQQFGITQGQEEELYEAYPERPRYQAPRENFCMLRASESEGSAAYCFH
jgi:hypothetical protein